MAGRRAPKSGVTPIEKPSGPLPRRNQSKYDWDQIDEWFISSVEQPTEKMIYEKWGVGRDTWNNHKHRFQLGYRRRERQADYAKQRARDRARIREQECLTFDDHTLEACKDGISIIKGRLHQLLEVALASEPQYQAVLADIRAGEEIDFSRLKSVIYFKEMKELADALKAYQEVGHKALGITESSRIDIAVAHVDDPLQVVASVGDELARPDIERISGVYAALVRAGVMERRKELAAREAGELDIVDVVEIDEDNGVRHRGERAYDTPE